MVTLSKSRRFIVVGTIAVGLAGALIFGSLLSWRRRQAERLAPATYVGQQRCAQCHAEQFKAWRSSHHAQAMQVTDGPTVLGNFNDAQFAAVGVSSQFFKKDGKFFVRTNGPGDTVGDYQLPYTSGIYPLQQYLVSFGQGRLQSFTVAWDTRDHAQGGQRWFDLYPEKSIKPGKALHWTGRDQTWNSMCADCHSTNVRKNYDLASDTYATSWSEMNVSCESCHGPGSKHVVWAESHKGGSQENNDPAGLVVDLKPARGSWSSYERWRLKTLHWEGEPRSQNEINTCAPCHSRRKTISSEYRPGQPLMDAYVPSLLEEGAYYADGQTIEQDYEWGSFVQSTMYKQGVTCSDCHDPHSGKLPNGSLNSLCGKCHPLANFGSQDHHHHKVGSAGTVCVNCHMPAQTSMVVGVSHDHSFRIPRPDFSVTYGTPNACNECHRDKSSGWAADTIARWYGSHRKQESQFVKAINAGRQGLPRAEQALTGVFTDSEMP